MVRAHTVAKLVNGSRSRELAMRSLQAMGKEARW